jgi:hypothetical protein
MRSATSSSRFEGEVGERRQAQAVGRGTKGRRPDDLARAAVHQLRTEYAGDDDDGGLVFARARRGEDAFEVGRAPRAATRARRRQCDDESDEQ